MTRKAQPPRPRTRVAITGTVSKPAAHLSFDASFALQYAHLWLTSNGSLNVPDSGIVRRALAVYMRHLEGATGRAEVFAVSNGCRASIPDEQDQQRALLRLYGGEPGQPLRSYHELRTNPEVRQQVADLNDRVDILVAQAMKERPISSKVRTYRVQGIPA